MPVKGLVLRGSRNLFIVRTVSGEIECRIKGKILKGVEGYYNPLAPGDIVEIDGGLILGLEKRRNAFTRFNQKGQAPQLIAANVDLVICVTSPAYPPFRPRFMDRLLLQAEAADIPQVIVCNKYDLAAQESSGAYDSDLLDTEERLSDFERIGIPVYRLSAKSGEGMENFKRFIAGKFSVLVGQSGVGKSSLVNALIPNLEIRTGEINEKFNRGNHTTTQSVLLDVPNLEPFDVNSSVLTAANAVAGNSASTRIIDTPGIRRFALDGIKAEDLVLYMKEFAPLAGKCSYGLSCSHKTEPGCKIMEAVAAGVIHEDRYDSFLRIHEELSDEREYADAD